MSQGINYEGSEPDMIDGEQGIMALMPDRSVRVSLVAGGTTPLPASSVTSFEVTVNDTAAALTGSYPKGSQFFADSANSSPIFIGGSTVTPTGATRGIPVAPGAFYTLPDAVHDLTLVFAIANSSGQKLVILGAA